MMKIRLIALFTVLSIILCLLPSCEKESNLKAIMVYVGDTNKQGYWITIDGETLTLDYQTKLALTEENFEAKKTFIETFGKEDAVIPVDKERLNSYFLQMEEIIASWDSFYAPAEDARVRQYWFVEVYYKDGEYKNYCGYENWPDNYSEYIALTQQLCGKLFPEKIAAYMPEDIAAEQAAATTTTPVTTVAPAA